MFGTRIGVLIVLSMISRLALQELNHYQCVLACFSRPSPRWWSLMLIACRLFFLFYFFIFFLFAYGDLSGLRWHILWKYLWHHGATSRMGKFACAFPCHLPHLLSLSLSLSLSLFEILHLILASKSWITFIYLFIFYFFNRTWAKRFKTSKSGNFIRKFCGHVSWNIKFSLLKWKWGSTWEPRKK